MAHRFPSSPGGLLPRSCGTSRNAFYSYMDSPFFTWFKHGRDYGAPLAGSAGSWCTYGVTNLESLLPELGAAYCCND